MIRGFNAFQLVVLFAALPFIIGWLHTEPFAGSTAAKYVAVVTYLILFVVHVAAVWNLVDNDKR